MYSSVVTALSSRCATVYLHTNVEISLPSSFEIRPLSRVDKVPENCFDGKNNVNGWFAYLGFPFSLFLKSGARACVADNHRHALLAQNFVPSSQTRSFLFMLTPYFRGEGAFEPVIFGCVLF